MGSKVSRHWKRHSSDVIVSKLQRADALVERGITTHAAATAIGVGQATYWRWRKRFAGLLPTQVQYIKQLEAELARLRAVVRELDCA